MKDEITAGELQNSEQGDYYYAMKAARSYIDLPLDCAIAGLVDSAGAFALTFGILNPSIFAVAFGAICIYGGLAPSARIARKIRHCAGLWITGRNPSAYPLEHVDSIILDDLKGLEMLLEMTARKEKLEWGTVQNAHEDKQRAVIHEIAGFYEAAKGELVGGATRKSIILDEKKAKRLGYNGFQHYHPRGGADNFEVSVVDRTTPMGFINLLSFNRVSGPELIGYNYKYTYIPADKSKTTLVKATPEQIMEYLK